MNKDYSSNKTSYINADIYKNDKQIKMLEAEMVLARIDLRMEKGIEVPVEELRFLYEIDKKRFDFSSDDAMYASGMSAHNPAAYRLWAENIIRKRDIKSDMALIFKCKPEQVYVEGEDVDFIDSENIRVLIGELNQEDCYFNLEAVIGDIHYPTNVDIKIPKLRYVTGNIYAPFVRSSHNLKSLIAVGGDVQFSHMDDDTGFMSLKYIGGNADFGDLVDMFGMVNLTTVEGKLDISSAECVDGLKNLEYTGGIDARNLSLDDGLSNLKIINGDANFSSVEEPCDLQNLLYVHGELKVYSEEALSSFPNLYVSYGAEIARYHRSKR